MISPFVSLVSDNGSRRNNGKFDCQFSSPLSSSPLTQVVHTQTSTRVSSTPPHCIISVNQPQTPTTKPTVNSPSRPTTLSTSSPSRPILQRSLFPSRTSLTKRMGKDWICLIRLLSVRVCVKISIGGVRRCRKDERWSFMVGRKFFMMILSSLPIRSKRSFPSPSFLLLSY